MNLARAGKGASIKVMSKSSTSIENVLIIIKRRRRSKRVLETKEIVMKKLKELEREI